MKSFSSRWRDDGCLLTIFTPVALPLLSDDGIDSCLCFASFLHVPRRISSDRRFQIFKALMNGPDGAILIVGRTCHCVYSTASGLMLFDALCILRSLPVPLMGLPSSYVVSY